jgi:hypothetical protein
METAARLRHLRFALVAVGLIFIVGVYPLTRLWPSGWRWQPDQPEYLQMILALYAPILCRRLRCGTPLDPEAARQTNAVS